MRPAGISASAWHDQVVREDGALPMERMQTPLGTISLRQLRPDLWLWGCGAQGQRCGFSFTPFRTNGPGCAARTREAAVAAAAAKLEDWHAKLQAAEAARKAPSDEIY